MKVSGFNEAVAQAISRNPSYASEGYGFLRESLEAVLKKRSKSKSRIPATGHVTASELLEGFRLHALREFGPMAPLVLGHWGIRTCSDVGKMVFLLVEFGAFGRTENDSPEDFENGFDFHEAFEAPFLPSGPAAMADRRNPVA